MSNFEDFKKDVITGAEELAKTTLTGFVANAKSDTQQFLQNQAQNVLAWIDDLRNEAIDANQYRSLLRGQIAIGKMHALTEAGVTAATYQRFRDGLIDIVVKATTKYFFPI